METYFKREDFEQAVLHYKKTKDNRYYEDVLYPMLNILVDMIIYKYTGKKNTDYSKSRDDYDSLRQEMFIRFEILLQYLDPKISVFSFVYRCLWQECVNSRRKLYTKVTKETTFTEMQTDDMDIHNILSNYKKEETDRKLDCSSLLKFAKYYKKNARGKSQRKIGEFFIYLFSFDQEDIFKMVENAMQKDFGIINSIANLYVDYYNMSKNSSKCLTMRQMRDFFAYYRKCIDNGIKLDEHIDSGITPTKLFKTMNLLTYDYKDNIATYMKENNICLLQAAKIHPFNQYELTKKNFDQIKNHIKRKYGLTREWRELLVRK